VEADSGAADASVKTLDAGVSVGAPDASTDASVPLDAATPVTDASMPVQDAGHGWYDSQGNVVPVIESGNKILWKDAHGYVWIIDQGSWLTVPSALSDGTKYYATTDCTSEYAVYVSDLLANEVFSMPSSSEYLVNSDLGPVAYGVASFVPLSGSCMPRSPATTMGLMPLTRATPAPPISGSGQTWSGPLTRR
jgi:hypothetical protein